MHEMLCFAGQNMSWKMDGEACPAGGSRTVLALAVPGSFSDRPRSGTDSSAVVFTSSAFTFGGMSRTKASFSHIPLALFEGRLTQKRRFHIFHFHFFRDSSHESVVFTSSTFTFSGAPRTKASFSHLLLSFFQGLLARKLRFHISHFHFLRECRARNTFSSAS